ncbi:MAG: hypothetical protein K6A23_05625 [Butyrivibrio sp.]|nr:hypothetical protein [Butyrivibrio sp.]
MTKKICYFILTIIIAFTCLACGAFVDTASSSPNSVDAAYYGTKFACVK